MDANTVRELIGALETIQRIEDEQAVDLARSRAEADRMHEMFSRRLSDAVTGITPSKLNFSELMSTSSMNAVDQQARQASREAAFLDAFHALMRLYVYEKARPSLDRIFQAIRVIRMTPFDAPFTEFVRGMPTFESPDPTEPREDQRKEMLKSVLDHDSRTEEFLASWHQGVDEQIARGERALREALSEARMLQSDLKES